jgi:hypothetical protein
MAQAQLKKKYVTAEEVVAPYCQADGTLVYQPAKILKCVQIRAAKQHAYHVQFQMDTGEALTQDWFFESALKDKEEGQFAFEKIVGARRHKSTCNVKNRRCNRDTGTPCNVYFEYKVKWEDYDESKNSWEADDNVGMYSDLVLQYWADVCANNPKLLKKMNLPPALRSRVKKYAEDNAEERDSELDGEDEDEDEGDDGGDGDEGDVSTVEVGDFFLFHQACFDGVS